MPLFTQNPYINYETCLRTVHSQVTCIFSRPLWLMWLIHCTFSDAFPDAHGAWPCLTHYTGNKGKPVELAMGFAPTNSTKDVHYPWYSATKLDKHHELCAWCVCFGRWLFFTEMNRACQHTRAHTPGILFLFFPSSTVIYAVFITKTPRETHCWDTQWIPPIKYSHEQFFCTHTILFGLPQWVPRCLNMSKPVFCYCQHVLAEYTLVFACTCRKWPSEERYRKEFDASLSGIFEQCLSPLPEDNHRGLTSEITNMQQVTNVIDR